MKLCFQNLAKTEPFGEGRFQNNSVLKIVLKKATTPDLFPMFPSRKKNSAEQQPKPCQPKNR